MEIKFSPPDITELEIQEVAKVLQSGWITTGFKTKEFEKLVAMWAHTEKAVCLNSATACLECILRILGIGPGDEVITSAYTYTASASVIHHVGANIILVDTAENSYEMDYDKLGTAITERTKAIIPVDLAGIICDYDKIFQIVEEQRKKFRASNNRIQQSMGRVAVIADAAHAFGASRKNKNCGEIADFTSFSFHAVKNLTTAEGGAAVWKTIDSIDNDWIYKQFQLLSLHGQDKDALAKTKGGEWEYDILALNYKCNMTDIMSAIGMAQLERYPSMLEKRKKIVQQYDKAFEMLPVQLLRHDTEYSHSSRHLYLVRLLGKSSVQRNMVIKALAGKGIATNVHYKPLPMLTAYKNIGFRIENYPNAYRQFENEITLPLHTSLTDEQVQYVIGKFSDLIWKD